MIEWIISEILICLKYPVWDNLSCLSLRAGHIVCTILPLGLQCFPGYKSEFLFDALPPFLPYRACQDNKFNFHLGCLLHFTTHFMATWWCSRYICSQFVISPSTFCRTLWNMLWILAVTVCSELVCRGVLWDCRILVDNMCFPNPISSHTSRKC